MHISEKLLKKKYKVIGIDNINNYYDIKIKKARLKILNKYKNFFFLKKDLRNKNTLANVHYKKI